MGDIRGLRIGKTRATGSCLRQQTAETVAQQGEALGKNEEFEISNEERAMLEDLGYGN